MVSHRLPRLSLLTVGVLILAGAPPAAAQTVEHAVMTVRGGLAIDGWGEISTPDSFVDGELIVRIPSGATVRRAWLFSVTRTGNADPTMPPVDPSRTVIVGSGSLAVTRDFVGMPDRPSLLSTSGFGVWVTDVTAAVADSLADGESTVPIRERGDSDSSFLAGVVFVQGHVLVVVYELPSAPLRHISIFGGTADNDFSGELRLAGPYQPCDPTDPGAEPAVLSVAFASELTACEEANLITAGPVVITDTGGGSDDWPGDPYVSGDACSSGPYLRGGLITVGSFGASLGASARDFPEGVEGDELAGTGGRLDDELYDFSSALEAGATTISVDFDIRTAGATGPNALLPVIAVQALAAGVDGDPERDHACDLVALPTDGGVSDGGVPVDGGGPSDGGGPTDGGVRDSSTGGDADTRRAAVTFAGGGGCACRAGGGSGAGWGLPALLLWAVRRRVRRER